LSGKNYSHPVAAFSSSSNDDQAYSFLRDCVLGGGSSIHAPFTLRLHGTLFEKTATFFECFPYDCPEPVLVKSSFLYINGSKRPFVLTGVGRVHQTLEETFKEVGGHRLPLRRKRLFFSVSGCLSRACLGKRSVSLVENGCKKGVSRTGCCRPISQSLRSPDDIIYI
jgi:hypothetical protein